MPEYAAAKLPSRPSRDPGDGLVVVPHLELADAVSCEMAGILPGLDVRGMTLRSSSPGELERLDDACLAPAVRPMEDSHGREVYALAHERPEVPQLDGSDRPGRGQFPGVGAASD